MRVVTIVNGYTGALCLQELVNQGDEVLAVVTGPGDPRPGADPKTSVKLTADRNYLPVYQPPMGAVNTPEFIAIIRKLAPDLIVSMHYATIFKPELASIPRLGCVNEHPSRLPAGRGMTPSFWHMIRGDERNWITLHFVDPGIDTGDVIAHGSIAILPEDTGRTNSAKLSEEGHRIFAENLPLIREGKAPRVPQNQVPGVESSYVSWKPWHSRIKWERTAAELALRVRTLTMPRGEGGWTQPAYTFLAGQRVNFRAALAEPVAGMDDLPGQPGQIMGVAGRGLVVKTGQGLLTVTDADVEGCACDGLRGVLALLPPGLPVRFD